MGNPKLMNKEVRGKEKTKGLSLQASAQWPAVGPLAGYCPLWVSLTPSFNRSGVDGLPDNRCGCCLLLHPIIQQPELGNF